MKNRPSNTAITILFLAVQSARAFVPTGIHEIRRTSGSHKGHQRTDKDTDALWIASDSTTPRQYQGIVVSDVHNSFTLLHSKKCDDDNEPINSLSLTDNRHELKATIQWITFAGALSAMSAAFHLAAMNEWLDVEANYWNCAAIGYPLIVAVACWGHWKFVFGDDSGGATIVKWMGGKECTPPSTASGGAVIKDKEEALLYESLTKVYCQSGLNEVTTTAPRLFIIPTAEANALAAGTQENSVVAVTSGLLDRLTTQEVQAVLAHEIGHIRNRDVDDSIRMASMIAGLGFAMNAGEILWRIGANSRNYDASSSSDDDDNSESGSASIYVATLGAILYVSGIVSFTMATLLRLYSSRQAEFAADVFSKSIGMGPELASALDKLSNNDMKEEEKRRDPQESLGIMKGAYAHAYIDNPPSRESSPLINLFGLLRTHPTMEERIEKLLLSNEDENNNNENLLPL